MGWSASFSCGALRPHQPKNKALFWIALYNVVISASMLGGKCSFIVSTVTDNSLLIGAVRASFYLLMPLSALFMRRKNFDEFLKAPNSCLLLPDGRSAAEHHGRDALSAAAAGY